MRGPSSMANELGFARIGKQIYMSKTNHTTHRKKPQLNMPKQ